jgi:hypothetical protein
MEEEVAEILSFLEKMSSWTGKNVEPMSSECRVNVE